MSCALRLLRLRAAGFFGGGSYGEAKRGAERSLHLDTEVIDIRRSQSGYEFGSLLLQIYSVCICTIIVISYINIYISCRLHIDVYEADAFS